MTLLVTLLLVAAASAAIVLVVVRALRSTDSEEVDELLDIRENQHTLAEGLEPVEHEDVHLPTGVGEAGMDAANDLRDGMDDTGEH